MANTARVTQSFTEAATSSTGTARVTQSFVEFAVGVGISCGGPANGSIGVLYSHTFPSGGGVPPITFSISSGALPPGLTLNTSTGVVSGTPTTPGTFMFTIKVADSSLGSASVACAITILGFQSVVITLVGWKLYPVDPCEANKPEAVPEAPPVKRAV